MAHTYTDLAGVGSTLSVTINSTPTLIPGCHEISWDGFAVSQRTPTALSDTHVRKKRGLPNFGSIKFKVYFDPNDTTHQYLEAAVRSSTPVQALDAWKVTYPDGFSTPAFATVSGYLSEFNESGREPETGTIIREGTIEVDNVTAFTPGAPTS